MTQFTSTSGTGTRPTRTWSASSANGRSAAGCNGQRQRGRLEADPSGVERVEPPLERAPRVHQKVLDHDLDVPHPQGRRTAARELTERGRSHPDLDPADPARADRVVVRDIDLQPLDVAHHVAQPTA